MRQLSWVVACALVSTGVALACGKKTETPKTVTLEDIKEKMIQVHKGDKSPLARARAEVRKEQPDWGQLSRNVKNLTEMADLLDRYRKIRPYTIPPESYRDAATALARAAKDKDRKAAGVALVNLSRSCGACHYGKRME